MNPADEWTADRLADTLACSTSCQSQCDSVNIINSNSTMRLHSLEPAWGIGQTQLEKLRLTDISYSSPPQPVRRLVAITLGNSTSHGTSGRRLCSYCV